MPLAPMARLLGVSSRWLREEAEAGRLPHLAAGDTILFDADLIERILIERARKRPGERADLPGEKAVADAS
jgi:hypothetical protein